MYASLIRHLKSRLPRFHRTAHALIGRAGKHVSPRRNDRNLDFRWAWLVFDILDFRWTWLVFIISFRRIASKQRLSAFPKLTNVGDLYELNNKPVRSYGAAKHRG